MSDVRRVLRKVRTEHTCPTCGARWLHETLIEKPPKPSVKTESGAALKALRLERGLTLLQVSGVFGATQSYLSRVEREGATPENAERYRIAVSSFDGHAKLIDAPDRQS